MSETTEVKPCSSQNLQRSGEQSENDVDKMKVDGQKDSVPMDSAQDQIIIAPEIMKRILKHLDLRSLKQVRLVCKSWLREARAHMERRGIVCLYTDFASTIIQDFMDTRRKEIPALTQPFKAIDVDLYNDKYNRLSYEVLLNQISGLSPPLLLTRFFPSNAPLKLVLPVIIQSSSTLEHLHLLGDTCEVGYLPPMDPEQKFPKLRRLVVDASELATSGNRRRRRRRIMSHFPSILAWIVAGSSNLDIYESWIMDEGDMELASELALRVDLKNVKRLGLCEYRLSSEALEHFMETPFSRLEHLRLVVYDGPYYLWSEPALIATMKKCADTLKSLDFRDLGCLRYHDFSEYPVCPHVMELTVCTFPFQDNYLSNRVPALQVLYISKVNLDLVVGDGEDWKDFSPLTALKTLSICKIKGSELKIGTLNTDKQPAMEVQFFAKFPAVERYYLPYSYLMRCCRLKARGDPGFLTLLQGLKHLELNGKDFPWYGSSCSGNYSSLAVLKELESITLMNFTVAITTLPLDELPCLKAIKFPLKGCSNIQELVKMSSGVEKIYITDCCSIPRVGNRRSKDLLNEFFDAVPNARCGCEEWENMPPFHWRREENPGEEDEDNSNYTDSDEDSEW